MDENPSEESRLLPTLPVSKELCDKFRSMSSMFYESSNRTNPHAFLELHKLILRRKQLAFNLVKWDFKENR